LLTGFSLVLVSFLCIAREVLRRRERPGFVPSCWCWPRRGERSAVCRRIHGNESSNEVQNAGVLLRFHALVLLKVWEVAFQCHACDYGLPLSAVQGSDHRRSWVKEKTRKKRGFVERPSQGSSTCCCLFLDRLCLFLCVQALRKKAFAVSKNCISSRW
jgi:hypothetical protein